MFRIGDRYSSPSVTYAPSDAQLIAYVDWMEQELALARKEMQLRGIRMDPARPPATAPTGVSGCSICYDPNCDNPGGKH